MRRTLAAGAGLAALALASIAEPASAGDLGRVPGAAFGYAPGFVYGGPGGAIPAASPAYGYDGYADAYPLAPPSNARYGYAWAPEAVAAYAETYPYGPDRYDVASGYYGY